MRKKHDRVIDGTTWTVNQFSATEGLRLLTRLMAIGGAPLARAIQALPTDGSILDARVDFGLLAAAISELTSRLEEAEVVELVKRLLACTLADGEDCERRFDVVFQGRYLTLFKVLGFVLEVNYQVPLADLLTAVSPTAGTGASPAAA